jgi:putative phosphoserine phosphatase/1-acylglycerol-3-phosphate O-acyltransferase
MSYRDRLAEIARAPEGPAVAAFFDLDRTLIAGFSAQDVLVERALAGDLRIENLARALAAAARFGAGQIEFVEFVNGAAADLAGRADSDNYAFGRDVFENRVAQRIYPEARALVEAHRARGHTLAVVSSATPYQVEPVAEDLGIPHVMCTRLEVRDGVCTGRVATACYGTGKADAARGLASERGIDLGASYFYSDGREDLPLFEIVGNPRPLNPDARLGQIAERRRWPVTRFESRGLPGPTDVARTVLAFGAAMPASGAALANFLLNGSARQSRNLFHALWAEMACAAAGIVLDVTGEEHLWSRRPAIFVFNHQSALDAVVLARLLRRDFAGVAKLEIANQPIVGQIASMLGTIFVDRGNTAQAVAALRPAVEALERGTSVVIAPEGTRSPTLRLGRFKKGAFHLALQARAPMVPVVIHNTTDALPKGALVPHPAAIRVEVLPPIDTRAWRVETIDRHIADVRSAFLRALGQADLETP